MTCALFLVSLFAEISDIKARAWEARGELFAVLAFGLARSAEEAVREGDGIRAQVCIRKAKRFLTEKRVALDLSIVVMCEGFKGGLAFPSFSLPTTAVYGIPLDEKHRDDYREAFRRGLVTIAPLQLDDPEWARKHPEHILNCYFLTERAKAESGALTIPIEIHDKRWRLDTVHDPKRWWYVFDRTERRRLRPDEWEFDPLTKSVRIVKPANGHAYQVAFLVQRYLGTGPLEGMVIDREEGRNVVGNIGPVPMLNPLIPEVQERLLKRLEGLLRHWGGYVDILRVFTALPYPTFFAERKLWGGGWDERGRRLRGWNWFGYACGVNPEVQVDFERETGVKFDLSWLLKCRYGEVNTVPTPEYILWRDFVRRRIVEFSRKVSELCWSYGVLTEFNFGDFWIGIEPKLGDVERGGFYSIAAYEKGREMITPGEARCVCKLWLANYGRKYADLSDASFVCGKLDLWWRSLKREILGRMIDGIRWETLWLVERAKGEAREKVARKVREISEEFLKLRQLLGGSEPFKFDLCVCVLDAWGEARAWQLRPRFVRLLLDLPVHIRFVSLLDVEKKGVPVDADVVLLFGPPGSAWSGGRLWESERLAEAVREFVLEKGGGLIGVDGPAYFVKGGRRCQLSDLFGFDFMPGRAKGKLVKTEMGRRHWLTKDLRFEPNGMRSGPKLKALDTDMTVLCSGTGKGELVPPVIIARKARKGRVVYISGWSEKRGRLPPPADRELLWRAILWCARKENLLGRIYTPTEGVSLYLYPRRKLLMVYNWTGRPKEAEVKVDPALLGFEGEGKVTVENALSGEVLWPSLALAELRRGIVLRLQPGEVKALRIAKGGAMR